MKGNSSGFYVPAWAATVLLSTLLLWSGSIATGLVLMYGDVRTLVERAERQDTAQAQYITMSSMEQMLARRDDRIDGLKAMVLDLRDQVRAYHPRSNALFRPGIGALLRVSPLVIAQTPPGGPCPPLPSDYHLPPPAVLPKMLQVTYGNA